ncbi:MAG: efflux RND transporter periplasmic adaptor subunit [Planctomycetota bacterium]|jgi:Cu(I)/Ag(I) efflux system membrane fusion protein|nr:efflux RND transporter periplasmic adaptor subunit [Planctomycetota bacterium]
MRRFIRLFLLVAFAAGSAGGLTSVAAEDARAGDAREIVNYRCPMHPWITAKSPNSKCTICGMNLTPVFAGDGNAAVGDDSVKLSGATASIIGVATAPAKIAPLVLTLRVNGAIGEDDTRHRALSARVPGRLEKLYVDQVGIEVAAGQPFADFYSPEMLTAQRLYLQNFRLHGTAGAVSGSDLATTREKLLDFGLIADDIKKLETEQKPSEKFLLRSPYGGTVTSRRAYEGQYVKVDDVLFEIGDFSQLWFVFDAYERDLPLLKINQPVAVTLTSLPGETITAPITFIDPNLNPTTRTARGRVVLDNPQRRILNGQTATGVVRIETAPALLIPRSAILYTHATPCAYVATGEGNYQFRPLTLGKIGDREAEVLSGVAAGEKVVTSAALIIDSQSQLAHIATPAAVAPMAMAENAAPKMPMTPVVLPEDLVRAMLAATAALAGDNLGEYQKQLPILQAAVGQVGGEAGELLSPRSAKLVAGENLTEAREPFEAFSSAVADLVRAQPAANRQARIFQCSMSPVLGTSRWLQPRDQDAVRNPFFGLTMLDCGAELQ